LRLQRSQLFYFQPSHEKNALNPIRMSGAMAPGNALFGHKHIAQTADLKVSTKRRNPEIATLSFADEGL
jgi:hypothetical protein